MNAKDRILEHALEQHYADEAPVDQAEEIAQKWAEGKRGSLEAWELKQLRGNSTQQKLSKGATLLRFSRSPWGWLAAAVLLAVLGTRLWERSSNLPTSPSPAALAWQVQLGVAAQLVGSQGALEGSVSRLQSGDTLMTSQELVGLKVAKGLLLSVQPASMFTLTRREEALELRLYCGRMELVSDRDQELAVNGVSLAIGTQSRLGLRSDVFTGAPRAELDQGRRAALLAGQDRFQDHLLLEVEAGRATLSSARLTLPAETGSEWFLVAGGEMVDAESWGQAKGLLASIMPTGKEGLAARTYWRMERAMKESLSLERILLDKPGTFALLEHFLITKLGAMTANKSHVSVLLDLIVADERLVSLDLARDLWLQQPEAFYFRHVAGLAARGCFEFERELGAQIKLWRREPELFEKAPLLMACFAALMGDAEGQDLLDQILREPQLDQIRSGLFVLSALGLQELGRSSAWELAMDTMQEFLEPKIAAGELGLALNCVKQLEHLAAFREDQDPMHWFAVLVVGSRASGKPGSGEATASDLLLRLRSAMGR